MNRTNTKPPKKGAKCFSVGIKSKGALCIVPPLVEVLDAGDTMCVHCRAALHTLGLYRELFVRYGFKNTAMAEEALLREFPTLHELSSKDELLAYLKFKCADAFSWAFGQERPAAKGFSCGTSTNVLVGGGYMKYSEYMRKHMSLSPFDSRRHAAMSFFNSILMLKKGLPRPSVLSCRQAVVKAYETMTTPVVRREGDDIRIERVCGFAKKIVRHLFHSLDWSQELVWPSASSHYGSSRRDIGAWGGLQRKGYLPSLKDEDFHTVRRFGSDDGRNQTEETDSWRLVMGRTGHAKLLHAQEKITADALYELPVAEPQALPEPLKIRIVTKGPQLTYTALRPVQKVLFRQLARDPRFCISGPITEETVSRTIGGLRKGCRWLSGDYKAATDNLAMELSNFIVDEIAYATDMPHAYHTLLRRALTEHIYTYALPREVDKTQTFVNEKGKTDYVRGIKKPQEFATPRPQLRGQLMGSPVSFPILCIANMALIWASVFSHHDDFGLVKAIVNGDDCLFGCTAEQKARWEVYAAAVGLEPSVGKTYFSEDFYVINSTMFDYTRRRLISDDGDNIFHSTPIIPFLNTGLMLGFKRSGDRETACDVDQSDRDSRGPIGARCRKLLEGFADSDILDTKGLYLAFELYNEGQMKSWVPRHLPVHLGGYALPEVVFEETDETWSRAYTAYLSGRKVPQMGKMTKEKDVKTGTYKNGLCSIHHSLATRRLGARFGFTESDEDLSVGLYAWVTGTDGWVYDDQPEHPANQKGYGVSENKRYWEWVNSLPLVAYSVDTDITLPKPERRPKVTVENCEERMKVLCRHHDLTAYSVLLGWPHSDEAHVFRVAQLGN